MSVRRGVRVRRALGRSRVCSTLLSVSRESISVSAGWLRGRADGTMASRLCPLCCSSVSLLQDPQAWHTRAPVQGPQGLAAPRRDWPPEGWSKPCARCSSALGRGGGRQGSGWAGSGSAAQRMRGLFWAAGRKLAVLLAAASGYRPAAGASDPTSVPWPGWLFLSSALFPRRPWALWVGLGEGPKRGSRANREVPAEVTGDGRERLLPTLRSDRISPSWCADAPVSLLPLGGARESSVPLVTPLPPGLPLGVCGARARCSEGKQQMPARACVHATWEAWGTLDASSAPEQGLPLTLLPAAPLVFHPGPATLASGLPNPTTGPLHHCFLPGISISQPSCSCPPPRAAPLPCHLLGRPLCFPRAAVTSPRVICFLVCCLSFPKSASLMEADMAPGSPQELSTWGSGRGDHVGPCRWVWF